MEEKTKLFLENLGEIEKKLAKELNELDVDSLSSFFSSFFGGKEALSKMNTQQKRVSVQMMLMYIKALNLDVKLERECIRDPAVRASCLNELYGLAQKAGLCMEYVGSLNCQFLN
jgi:hypothetical protein